MPKKKDFIFFNITEALQTTEKVARFLQSLVDSLFTYSKQRQLCRIRLVHVQQAIVYKLVGKDRHIVSE